MEDLDKNNLIPQKSKSIFSKALEKIEGSSNVLVFLFLLFSFGLLGLLAKRRLELSEVVLLIIVVLGIIGGLTLSFILVLKKQK